MGRPHLTGRCCISPLRRRTVLVQPAMSPCWCGLGPAPCMQLHRAMYMAGMDVAPCETSPRDSHPFSESSGRASPSPTVSTCCVLPARCMRSHVACGRGVPGLVNSSGYGAAWLSSGIILIASCPSEPVRQGGGRFHDSCSEFARPSGGVWQGACACACAHMPPDALHSPRACAKGWHDVCMGCLWPSALGSQVPTWAWPSQQL